jgi:hypothetical protein
MAFKKKKKNSEGSASLYETAMIRGILIPAGWDEKGNIIAIAVSAFDEEVYHIENDEKGRQLMPLIREEIEVKGTIIQEDSLRKIRVDNYIIKKRR